MRKLHHSKPQVGKHVQHVKALIAQLQQSIVLDEDDDTRHTWCTARLSVVFDPGDKELVYTTRWSWSYSGGERKNARIFKAVRQEVAAFGTLVAAFGTIVS
ncbi:hypothetical protein SELMODRAFT_409134 [Selaginella moellendorffii]|uniref:Uncharacterized protein n=1 Tax=Selaginella moellendorffii TaxID=88036 RepID=D8RAG8_SELML|nr:hypothetical protein SELMODRAFT_409134 [Selaginella moellendorffii]